ncbi:uncharacterized protein LOC8278593 isoform X2 [Ricinus communis]|uniref:uncharacterized protein LOC8278593 isoform X2 n=1 Tax=Ricinus communis TaxID=3988 RepID=UPI0007726311|nr:uncharacterized protein LOC8278593 isoform X2 [Ricinus communis]|eukprot:XP_015572521.1 uncharacterized protein LOC8278593 isoform X2 [Ricinus communis]
MISILCLRYISQVHKFFHNNPSCSPSPSPFNRITSHTMSCSRQTAAFPTVRTVTIPYSDLKVPGFPSLRRNLLHLSSRLASLPEEKKKELEDPNSRYNFGWSHGKEKLESGKPDLFKGSFYANPVLNVPTTDPQCIQRYPHYCGSNIWPDSILPELEIAFKGLGKLILDVGVMLAYHCDQYVSKGMKTNKNESLEQILLRSRCHKGRLLYYFPAQKREYIQDGHSVSSWCGWHTDHGSLTGLTCAMFKGDGVEIPCPDSAAGLYIKTRTDQIVKVIYGEDEIAFQVGETTEILSRGYLCATPHCVRAPKGQEASGVDRSTFALFMQPDWDEMLNFPDDMHIHEELMLANCSIKFGEYTEKLLDKYYSQT